MKLVMPKSKQKPWPLKTPNELKDSENSGITPQVKSQIAPLLMTQPSIASPKLKTSSQNSSHEVGTGNSPESGELGDCPFKHRFALLRTWVDFASGGRLSNLYVLECGTDRAAAEEVLRLVRLRRPDERFLLVDLDKSTFRK